MDRVEVLQMMTMRKKLIQLKVAVLKTGLVMNGLHVLMDSKCELVAIQMNVGLIKLSLLMKGDVV